MSAKNLEKSMLDCGPLAMAAPFPAVPRRLHAGGFLRNLAP
jgi:hypothetical protein